MGVTQSVAARLEGYDSNPTLATLRRYALAVGALLEFRAVSDDSAYVTPDNVESASPRSTPSTTTSNVDWAARRVVARA